MVYHYKSTLDKDETKNMLSEDKISEAKAKIDEYQQWLYSNENASAEEFDAKRVELEQLIQTFMARSTQHPNTPESSSEASESEPVIEEID